MPAERFYVDSPLEKGQTVLLEEMEFHHLRVMRAEVGDSIELVNGKGALAQATIDQIGKHKATLSIKEVEHQEKPSFELILAQAIPRLNRLDFILEKGTELGMTQLWLFPGTHSERKSLTEQQIKHMKAVTISAMKQCGRLHLPQLEVLQPLAAWSKPPFPLLFGDLDPQAPWFIDSWQTQTPSSGVIFVTGPESGFSPDEGTYLRKLGMGVKLHPYVLRTDSASIAALSLISHMKNARN